MTHMSHRLRSGRSWRSSPQYRLATPPSVRRGQYKKSRFAPTAGERAQRGTRSVPRAPLAGPTCDTHAVEAVSAARHLYPASRHGIEVGLLSGRSAGTRARSMRKSICFEKIFYVVEAAVRPRSGSRRQETPQLRVAAGLALRHSDERLHRIVNASSAPGASPCRHDGARRAQHAASVDAVFNCPMQFRDRFFRRRRLLQIQ